MSFAISMKFTGDSYLSVNPLAIQWDSKGAYVWKITDRKAVKTPVNIIQRNSYSVLINSDLKVGDLIVIQGTQNLHNNSPINIKNLTDIQDLQENELSKEQQTKKVTEISAKIISQDKPGLNDPSLGESNLPVSEETQDPKHNETPEQKKHKHALHEFAKEVQKKQKNK